MKLNKHSLAALLPVIGLALTIFTYAGFQTRVFGQAVSENASTDSAQKAEQLPQLKVERKGYEVTLTWTLPEGEWLYVTIMRNDQPYPKGRDRIKTLRPYITTYTDQIPDATRPYWYWLKITNLVKEHTELSAEALVPVLEESKTSE